MRTVMLRSSIVLAALAFAGAGCFNDAFRGHEFIGTGTDRFELVIEPDRTLVDGTHFLVDRATGDLWRLDVAGRTEGTWVRLAAGPADAAEIPLHPALAKKAESEDD
ncbi:MAG TPA: hypothetical protein VKB65_11930 [Myxococcota bacterium]|nr:hypothetical protein [Myxococcota bacterium]